jgi:5,10-methylenetetrahydrofolate reductase
VSALEKALQTGHFVVTAEVSPPKGIEVQPILAQADHLRDWVEALNVTDQQSSVMRLGSLALCHLLVEQGIEPIFQVTCRDRNRIALESDLLSAAALGIENVLCLTGDYVTLGDHPVAMPVFDLDSVTLLQTVTLLEQGHDLAGKELLGCPRFFPGAVVNPGANPLEPQLAKMEKKIRAGARFFQTQAVFEPEKFARFMAQAGGFNVPILIGIIPLKSAGMARFMNRNVAGVQVPEPLIEAMNRAEDRVRQGIEIAAGLIREMQGLAQGIHLMPLGWEQHVPAILQASGLGQAAQRRQPRRQGVLN